jgi:hypothetical protein
MSTKYYRKAREDHCKPLSEKSPLRPGKERGGLGVTWEAAEAPAMFFH